MRTKSLLNLVFFIGLIAAVFYASGARQRTENFFFDFFTRLKSSQAPFNDIKILKIDKNQNLNADEIKILFSVIKKSHPKALIYLDFAHFHNHFENLSENLIQSTIDLANGYVGFVDAGFNMPTPFDSPFIHSLPKGRVFPFDQLKKRSNSIVRTLPRSVWIGPNELPSLPVALGQQLSQNDTEIPEHYTLNYLPESSFSQLSVWDLIESNEPRAELLGKVVFLGFSVDITPPHHVVDYIKSLTPYSKNFNNYSYGESTIYLTALAFENIYHNRYLKSASKFVCISYAFFLCLCMIYIWQWPSIQALMLTALVWTFSLLLHPLLMYYFNYYLCYSDAFLFSLITVLVLGYLRIRREIIDHAKEAAALYIRQDMADLQKDFLNQFSEQLLSLNQKIASNIPLIKTPDTSTDQELKKSANESCEEFSRYIKAIRDIGDIEGLNLNNLQKEHFDMKDTVIAICRSFEDELRAKEMSIDFAFNDNSLLFSYKGIIEHILINFLSNAIKFSPPHSTIQVGQSGVPGHFYVRDQGPGLDPHDLDAVFHKFYTKKGGDELSRHKGSGLGLYLSRFLAEAIRAKVYARNNSPESGATFTLEIPQ
jgi:signal transduction histidine kinase